MKAVVKEKKTEETEITYPWMGICYTDKKYSIVIFSEHKKGVCVFTNEICNYVGELYDDWAEEMFTPFTGTIELSND